MLPLCVCGSAGTAHNFQQKTIIRFWVKSDLIINCNNFLAQGCLNTTTTATHPEYVTSLNKWEVIKLWESKSELGQPEDVTRTRQVEQKNPF